MTASQIILSIIEFSAICLVIVALLNETKIAKWERRMFKRIGRCIIRAYDRRQEKKAQAAQQKQSSPKIVYTNYRTTGQRHNVA